jgi:uncharacterized protein YoxC
MTLIAQMGALLLQGAIAAPETTIVRAVQSGPGWYTVFREIASGLTSVVFLALMLLLIPAVAKFRKTARRFAEVLEHVERSIDPVTVHASRIADNVDYVTTAVRADVQVLRRTLHDANDRVRDAMDGSERRLQELGALLKVMQEEAEHAFVSTAASVRGVRAGAATFRQTGELPLDDDGLDSEYDDLDAVADAAEEIDDGYDNGAALERAEPRVRRPKRRDSA